MNQNTNPPEQQMMQFIIGKWISKPIYVAAKLGIADMLAQRNRNIEELAEMSATMADPLYRMMRALAGIGIFTETKNRVFENTPLSECLKKGRLKSAALMFESNWHSNIWNNLLYSIQTGKPSFEKVFDKPAFEWFRDNPKQADIFNEANSFKAVFTHRIIKTIKKNKLENRMGAVQCDFFKEIPVGSDAYLLSHILHDWPDEKCINILKNCRKVMDSKGKLLIIEGIIPSGNEFSVSKLLDLEVLLMGGGCERTKDEFEELFKKSGFQLSEIVQTDEGISIIAGVPE